MEGVSSSPCSQGDSKQLEARASEAHLVDDHEPDGDLHGRGNSEHSKHVVILGDERRPRQVHGNRVRHRQQDCPDPAAKVCRHIPATYHVESERQACQHNDCVTPCKDWTCNRDLIGHLAAFSGTWQAEGHFSAAANMFYILEQDPVRAAAYSILECTGMYWQTSTRWWRVQVC